MAFTPLAGSRKIPAPATIFREGHAPLEPPVHLQAGFYDDPSEEQEEAEIVEQIYATLLREHDAKSHYQAMADGAWEAWLNEHPELAKKAGWQESARIPLAWVNTERAVAAFMKYLTLVPDWFDFDAVLPSQELAINVGKEIIRYDLEDDRTGFWGTIEDAFRQLMLTGNTDIFAGFEIGRYPITSADGLDPTSEEVDEEDDAPIGKDDFSLFGKEVMRTNRVGTELGVLAPLDSKTEDGKQVLLPNPDAPRPHIKLIPFEAVFRDSTGRSRYVMWITYSNIGDFREEAEVRGWDPDAVERAIASAGTNGPGFWGQHGTRWRDQVYAKKGGADSIEYKIEMVNFQGRLYHGDTGEIVLKDKYAIVANGVLLTDPSDPPFWDKELPLVSSRISRNPKAVYGRAPIAESLDILDLQVHMALQMADGIKRHLDPPYIVDKSVVHEDVRNKPMGPGVVYNMFSHGSSSPGIRKVETAPIDGNLSNAVQQLNILFGAVTGAVTDDGSGPRTRNRMSGKEFATREQQSEALIEHFFNNIDKELLTKLLRLWLLRRLQFTPQSQWRAIVNARRNRILQKMDPKLTADYNQQLDELAEWGPEERYKNIGGFLRFRVKVFGSALQRQIEGEKVTSLFNVAWRSPEIMQAINIPFFISQYVQSIGWDPEQALNPAAMPRPVVSAERILDGDEEGEILPQVGMGGQITPQARGRGRTDQLAEAPNPVTPPPTEFPGG